MHDVVVHSSTTGCPSQEMSERLCHIGQAGGTNWLVIPRSGMSLTQVGVLWLTLAETYIGVTAVGSMINLT